MTNLQNGTPPKVKPAGGEARARYWQGVFAVDFVTICNKNSFWSLLSTDEDAAMILSWHKRFGNGFRRVANGVFACVCVVSWTSFQQPRKGRRGGRLQIVSSSTGPSRTCSSELPIWGTSWLLQQCSFWNRIKVQSASLIFFATKKEAEEFAAGLQALANTTQEIPRDQIAHFHSEIVR